MGPSGKAGLTAVLLCGGLVFGAQVSSAAVTARHVVTPNEVPTPPAESPDASAPAAVPADGPATIKAALQEMADHFGFALIGANRLSNDPPSWPSEDLPEVQMLHALLKDYSYIVVLKPKAGPSGEREPAKVMIVSHNPTPAAPPPEQPHGPPARHAITPPYQSSALPPTSAVASAGGPQPTGHAPSWAPPPSTVVKTLASLASTSVSTTQAAAAAGQAGSSQAGGGAAPAAMPNPAEDANAMANLTRSAQAGLGALVTGLRQACPNPNAC